jgi:hypothetical protein
MEVATQWRSSGFSILGLDYPCLYQEAGRLGIELTTRTMRKIKALEKNVLEAIRDRDNGDRRGQPGEMA